MNDSLTHALSFADRLRAGCRKTASASAGQFLVNQPNGSALYRPGIMQAAEQYRHFRGWTYCAVRAIAQRVAGQSVYVARVTDAPVTGRKGLALPRGLKALGDRLEPLAAHPLLSALDDPNELMVRWSLLFITVASLELTGRAHWWLAASPRGNEIWPIPAHWIEPVDPMRGAWCLRPFGGASEVILPGEDVAYFSLPDPGNPFGWTSPLQTQALAVSADEELQNSQYRAFRNGIFPQFAITVGSVTDAISGKGVRPVLEPEQRQQVTEAIKSYYQGAMNYGWPLLLDGMIEKIEPLTTAPREMDFLDSGKQTKSRIMQAFGVNPLIVGEIEGANRAQAVVAEQIFCSSTINPLLELMGQTLTGFVGHKFAAPGEKLVAWLEPCRADDPEERRADWEVALKYGAATLNEYRVQVLNLAADNRFDVALSPVTMQPLP
ncbi:MAG: phage portal protein [Planctomycetes bacterium]|nr:phage portal protein [Planctomycetota bacterium]